MTDLRGVTEKKRLTFAEIRKRDGITLPEIRRLEAAGNFPPVEWTGPRSGFVWAADYEAWKASRHERQQQRVQREQLLVDYVKGAKPSSSYDFLKRS